MKKKTLLLLVVAIIVSNCEIKPRQSIANVIGGSAAYQDFNCDDIYNTGMHYVLFHGGRDGGACTINVTKDSLECEVLRKQLANNNK